MSYQPPPQGGYPPNYQPQGQPPYQGPPPQGYPQQPPPPKKKGKPWLWILIGAVVIIALCSIIANGTNTGTTTTNSTQSANKTVAPTTAPKTNKHFKVGEEVTVGSNWKVIANSFTANPGDGQFNVPQKGTYVILNITFTNVSASPQTLSSLLDFEMKGTDGTRYTEALVGGLPGVSSSPGGTIEAGGLVKGDLVYDVPLEAKTFTFAFKPSLASRDQTIWDLTL